MNKEEEIHWGDAETIEQWVRRFVREGREKEIVKYLSLFPDQIRQKYKEILIEELKKKTLSNL